MAYWHLNLMSDEAPIDAEVSESTEEPPPEEEEKETVSAITPLAVDQIYKQSQVMRSTNEIMKDLRKKGAP